MQGTHAHSIHWRSFADRLSQLAETEGHPRFTDQAFRFINDLITVDSCAVFKVAADRQSGAVHMCTFGRLDTALANSLAQDYVDRGFKNDPMVQTALTSKSVRVRHLSHSQYSESYRHQFFHAAGLSDKVSSIHRSRDVLYLINFYRFERQGKFTADEFRDLQRLGPIIGRCVLRHIQISRDAGDDEETLDTKISALFSDNTLAFSVLSPREREVCQQLLLGDSEKEIALSGNVSINTVITHRRRAYAKLGLSSQADLFRLALIISP